MDNYDCRRLAIFRRRQWHFLLSFGVIQGSILFTNLYAGTRFPAAVCLHRLKLERDRKLGALRFEIN